MPSAFRMRATPLAALIFMERLLSGECAKGPSGFDAVPSRYPTTAPPVKPRSGARRDDPQVEHVLAPVVLEANDALGLPGAHVEVVRHDAAARGELGEELRPQAAVQIGAEIERHDGRVAQIRLEDVLLDETHAVAQSEARGRR